MTATATTIPLSRALRPHRRPAAPDIAVTSQKGGGYTALGYRSANTLAASGVYAHPGSGDYHAQFVRSDLINQSRQFWRENGLYKGLIDRAVSNIVGSGFALQAQTDDADWNDRVETLWREEFARKPEVRGLWAWRQVQQMVMREVFLCGDTAAIKVGKGEKRGRIQLLEAERICSRDMGNGIDLDDFGEPVRFWVGSYSAGQVDARNVREYNAAQVLYVPLLDRPSQTRGVPPCQSSFPMLHRIADTCDAEALAMQLLSRLAVSIEKENAGEWGYGTSRDDPDQAASEEEGDFSTRLHELEYALIFWAKPGEKITGIDRNIPGKNFPESIKMFLRLLGLPLGLPLEIVLLDWSETNYSSARASLEQAFRVFTDYQLLLTDRFHDPVYRWKVRGWIQQRKLPTRPDRFKHAWITPSFPWIDQLKEAQAWGAKLDRGLVTHAQACKSLGIDRDEIVLQRRREVEEAVGIAKEIEAVHGVRVPYQIFCGLKASRRRGEADDLADVRDVEDEPREPREPAE